MSKNNKTNSITMVASKSKNKVITCSTPEHQAGSPSRDSDSMYDSDASSPVPFLCTQDGAEGETDVVWNFYTPNSKHNANSRSKNSTPLSRKTKRTLRPKLIEKQLPKRRPMEIPHKTQLFQELLELNQKLPELLAKTQQGLMKETLQSGSEEDIFNDSPEHSPKAEKRNKSRCLRKNVLNSKFPKPEPETALESDDSMNECLIRASQIVEENFNECRPTTPKRACYESHHKKRTGKRDIQASTDFRMDQDSMDAILNSIKLESPAVTKVKKFASPKLGNDSFDSFVGNLNDSALEQLTQMPIKSNVPNQKTKPGIESDWTLKELIVHDGSPSSKSVFTRHSSMPESPSIAINKPSSSGMVFGRYNSMPDKNEDLSLSDSPIRCTPDEIKRKHQLAREKLLAKRQLPFTSTQKNTIHSMPEQQTQQTVKNTKFQPRLPSSVTSSKQKSNLITNSNDSQQIIHTQMSTNHADIKSIIEKKRQEALMKLRRRLPK